MQFSHINTDRLIPYVGNPKQHDADQVSRIADSITEFGFNVPVLVDDDCHIVAGHGRVLAARKLGLGQVPVITVSHLDEHQKKAFMLADNRLQELGGGWNDDLLRVELADLQAADFDIELTGFTEDDFASEEDDSDDELDAENQCPAPDEKQPLVSVRGDVWQLGEHRLLCGDATNRDEVCAYIKEERAEMMFTDPPYGVNYQSERRGVMIGDRSQATIPFSFALCIKHVLSQDARIYICGGGQNVQMYYSIFDFYLHIPPRMIIWIKENQILRPNHYHSQYEIVFFGWKNRGIDQKYWHGGRTADNCSDVFQIHRDHSKDYVHPTQKPVELSLRCITNSSQKGDIIYDPFGGSGSTLIACEKAGRLCRMIEIDPRFCDVIIRRWQEYTDQQAVHADTGKTFEAMNHERQKTDPH